MMFNDLMIKYTDDYNVLRGDTQNSPFVAVKMKLQIIKLICIIKAVEGQI